MEDSIALWREKKTTAMKRRREDDDSMETHKGGTLSVAPNNKIAVPCVSSHSDIASIKIRPLGSGKELVESTVGYIVDISHRTINKADKVLHLTEMVIIDHSCRPRLDSFTICFWNDDHVVVKRKVGTAKSPLSGDFTRMEDRVDFKFNPGDVILVENFRINHNKFTCEVQGTALIYREDRIWQSNCETRCTKLTEESFVDRYPPAGILFEWLRTHGYGKVSHAPSSKTASDKSNRIPSFCHLRQVQDHVGCTVHVYAMVRSRVKRISPQESRQESSFINVACSPDWSVKLIVPSDRGVDLSTLQKNKVYRFLNVMPSYHENVSMMFPCLYATSDFIVEDCVEANHGNFTREIYDAFKPVNVIAADDFHSIRAKEAIHQVSAMVTCFQFVSTIGAVSFDLSLEGGCRQLQVEDVSKIVGIQCAYCHCLLAMIEGTFTVFCAYSHTQMSHQSVLPILVQVKFDTVNLAVFRPISRTQWSMYILHLA
jgi:hypothetical protein